MMPVCSPDSRYSRLYSALLIALQFVLSIVIVLAIPFDPPQRPLAWPARLGCLLIASSSLVAIWAWFTMGLTRLRIVPEPATGSRLIVHGPYAWIRHPMYSGVLFAMLGIVLLKANGLNITCWSGLAIVLWLKSGREEILLTQVFNGYPAYTASTGRFLPRIW